MSAALSRADALRYSWRMVLPRFAAKASGGAWKPYRWLDALLRAIQPIVLRGGARVIINAPPRHGKSESFSHWLPAWFLEWFPERRVLLTSYSDSFAAYWGRRVREEFERNPLLATKLSKTKTESSDWETVDGGGMKTAGAQGGITGRGGNLIICDDPHKDWEEANSPTIRRKIIERFNADLYTRLEPGGSIVVIMTRWHESDLTGYLVREHADDWELVALPALAESDDPLGRQPGAALCPERYDEARLIDVRKAVGSMVFNGLFQQHPSPLEGGMVKRDWFRRWIELPKLSKVIQSWDLTFTDTGTSFVVGQVWGVEEPNYYLLDQRRERLDFPGTLRAIRVMSTRWPEASEKVVEEAANGYAAISTLKDELDGVVGVKPKGSKASRLAAVSGLIEAGNVYIPDDSIASWVGEFVEEVVSFPNAANDDQCDAMTMGLSRLRASAPSFNFSIPDVGLRASPWEFSHGTP